MKWLEQLTAVFLLWVDAVARTLGAAVERFRPRRQINVIEDDEAGGFMVQLAQAPKGRAGSLPPRRIEFAKDAISSPLPPEWAAAFRDSRVELILQSSRFLFRPIELPKRAGEFLEGIVRAQIDRLTPWHATEACYHWTPPAEIAGERISLTVAATARAVTAPLAQALFGLGVASVDVATVVPGTSDVCITVLTQRAGKSGGLSRVRAALLVGFLGTGLLAAMSIGTSEILGARYDDQAQVVQRRIAERRALIRDNRGGPGGSALELLERRKQSASSSVMVIEALSGLLPDHTFATEVRIDADKLQIVGITRDAPSLIGLLEQSPHFTRATFFAPTTRAPNDPGERFHIEAKIIPYFRSGT